MIPKNINNINTDISKKALKNILVAIKNNKIKFESIHMYAEETGANFNFNGNQYSIVEEYEMVTSIMKI